jgi:hypothetical protein
MYHFYCIYFHIIYNAVNSSVQTANFCDLQLTTLIIYNFRISSNSSIFSPSNIVLVSNFFLNILSLQFRIPPLLVLDGIYPSKNDLANRVNIFFIDVVFFVFESTFYGKLIK